MLDKRCALCSTTLHFPKPSKQHRFFRQSNTLPASTCPGRTAFPDRKWVAEGWNLPFRPKWNTSARLTFTSGPQRSRGVQLCKCIPRTGTRWVCSVGRTSRPTHHRHEYWHSKFTTDKDSHVSLLLSYCERLRCSACGNYGFVLKQKHKQCPIKYDSLCINCQRPWPTSQNAIFLDTLCRVAIVKAVVVVLVYKLLPFTFHTVLGHFNLSYLWELIFSLIINIKYLLRCAVCLSFIVLKLKDLHLNVSCTAE